MFSRTKFYDVLEYRPGMENTCKGKSVVHENNSPVPEEKEDITKTKVLLRIDCIDELINLEGEKAKQKREDKSHRFADIIDKIMSLDQIKQRRPGTDDVKNLEGQHLEGEEQQDDKIHPFAEIIDKIMSSDQIKQRPKGTDDDIKKKQEEHVEGEEWQKEKRRGFADITEKPAARYYVSISLENMLDGKYVCKETQDRCRMMRNYPIRWAHTDIQFDIEYMKIHESVLKLEVIRHYEKGDMNVPYEEVETSSGARVVGRAKIPLSDFLEGDVRKIPSDDLLSGDKNRTKLVQLVKMDGSEPKNQGLLQVYMTVKKVINPTKRSFHRALYDNALGLLSGFTYPVTTFY